MRTFQNPFTGETEPYPPPKTYLCPIDKRPDRETISATLGFRVPVPFVQLVEWIYDESHGDPYECVEFFGRSIGLSAAKGSARYDSTPSELFPFGVTGVDGDHYGYLIHAPELCPEDYPVCHHCPMDSDGVVVVGPDTYEGIAGTMVTWGDPDIRPIDNQWAAALAKVHRRKSKRTRIRTAISIPTDWAFLPSSDGVGVLAPSRLFASHKPTEIDPYGPIDAYLAAAEAAILDGTLATALYYLREGYWFGWTERPISLCERLCEVYDKLDRSSLAAVIQQRLYEWQNGS